MRKNIEIFAPVSSGRSYLGRKIIKALGGDKVGVITIVDELQISDPDDFVVGPKTREQYLIICLGFTTVPADALRPKQKAEELLEQSRNWKDFAEKHNVQYFDVTKRDEKTYDNIVEWVKRNI